MLAVVVPISTPSLAGGRAGEAAAWEQIVDPVRPFLDRVSHQLVAQVEAFEPEIVEYARYALDSRGKQLRPALIALAGGAVGTVTNELVTVAVIIEMIHLATLVHDDIMDGASLRRRRSTLSARWGNEVSVLLGDCLFAHALKLAASFSTADVCRAVADATGIVCAGEILQTHRRRRWNLTRAEYFKMLAMKTAELFALACELGAKMGGGTVGEQLALRRYGLALGTAYQIYDDCLDVFGVEGEAGKSLGTDLANGKPTLPVLIFLENAGSEERAELMGWLNNWHPELLAGVRDRLERAGVLVSSAEVIRGFLGEAAAAVKGLSATPSLLALNHFSDFLSQRISSLGV